MTDTTKPNGDRDRPSDCEAAKNPRVVGKHVTGARHGIAARAGRRVGHMSSWLPGQMRTAELRALAPGNSTVGAKTG